MKYVLMGIGVFVVMVAAVAVYVVYLRDPVDMRYDTMAIGMEDHCKRFTEGDKCVAFAECYRDGIEDAFPRDYIRQIIDGKLKPGGVPAEVEASVRELEKSCGAKVGLNVGG